MMILFQGSQIVLIDKMKSGLSFTIKRAQLHLQRVFLHYCILNLQAKKAIHPNHFLCQKEMLHHHNVTSIGLEFNPPIIQFKHGANNNENGFIKPFVDVLDTPKAQQLAADIQFVQMSKRIYSFSKIFKPFSEVQKRMKVTSETKKAWRIT